MKEAVPSLSELDKGVDAERAEAFDALREHVRLLVESGEKCYFDQAVEEANSMIKPIGRWTRVRSRMKQGCFIGSGARLGSGQKDASNESPEERIRVRDMATVKYLRARALVQLKDFDKAQPDVEEAVEIRTKLLGEKDPEMPKTLSLQGQVYMGQKKLDEALEIHKKAKELRIELFGKDHSEVAASLSNIHKVLKEQAKGKEPSEGRKKRAEALEALEEALNIQRRYFGREHTYVVSTEEQMGQLLKKMERFDEAAEYFKKALKTAERIGSDKANIDRLRKAFDEVYRPPWARTPNPELLTPNPKPSTVPSSATLLAGPFA